MYYEKLFNMVHLVLIPLLLLNNINNNNNSNSNSNINNNETTNESTSSDDFNSFSSDLAVSIW